MPICLTVPGRAEALAVVRSLIVGAGADTHLPVDSLEDLALAAHETAAGLIALGARSLEIGIRPEGAKMDLAVGGDVVVAPWPPSRWADTLSGRVVEALADQVSHRVDVRGCVVVLAKRAPTS
jgi:hypothetical protein